MITSPWGEERWGQGGVLRCFKDALFFSVVGAISFPALRVHVRHSSVLWCTFQCKCLLRATDKHIGSHGSRPPASSIAKRAALRRLPAEDALFPLAGGAEGSLSVQRASVFPRFDFLCQRLSVGSLLLNVSASFCLPLTRVSCGPSPFKK